MQKLEPPGRDSEMKDEDQKNAKSVQLSWNERFSRSVVRKPCCHYLVSWGVVLFISMVAAGSGWFNVADFTSNDWADPSSKESKALDAYLDARDKSDTSFFFENQGIEFRTQNAFYVAASIIYEWNDESRTDDIFSAENVKAICEFERLIFGHPEFPRFCITENADGLETKCSFDGVPIISAAFYNSSMDEMIKCNLLDEVVVEEVRSELLGIQEGIFFFDIALETDANANSAKTRSFLPFGGPLGPDSTDGKESFLVPMEDEEDDSYPYYEDFLTKVVEIIDEELGVEDSLYTSGYFKKALIGINRDIRVRYYSQTWNGIEINQTFSAEAYIILLAIIAVGVLMYYHIRNFYVVLLGVTANMFSIPVALFVYRGIFQIDYFTSMHIIIFFLIIGIGADNIFVFFDSWKQSESLWINATDKTDSITNEDEAAARNRYGTSGNADNVSKEVEIYRLKYTITIASTSIFNTMSTTFAAFIATAFNPLAPIAGFGIFAAFVVMCNYLFVFIFSAPLMILYENKFTNSKCCCGVFSKLTKKWMNVEESNETDEKAREKVEVHSTWTSEESVNLETKFFDKCYVPIMTKFFPWLQIALIVGHLIFFSVMTSKAAKLELPNKAEEYFREGHMYRGFFEIFTTEFAGGADESFDNAVCTFGIEGLDRDGFKRLDPAGFRGEAIFDDDFDIAPSSNQLYFLSVCEDLRSVDCTRDGDTEPLKGCLGPEPNLIVFPDTLTCVLEEFYEFMENNGVLDKAGLLALGDTDPVAFYEHLHNFSISENNADLIGFLGDRLAFIAISFTTSTAPVRPSSERSPVFDLLNDFLREKSARGPEALDPIGLAGRGLAFISGEETLVSGMFQGLSISIPFAYIVLLYGTDNIVLATFALFSIVGIIVSLLGTMETNGSTLGYIQTTAAIMVVGLSVDYTVHIGHMYDVAGSEGHHSRNDRFAVAARRMGPTVFAGFLTTAASAAIMQLCQMTLFPTMGSLILTTVAYSLEVALFFYLPLCLLVGPENQYGKISLYFKDLGARKMGGGPYPKPSE